MFPLISITIFKSCYGYVLIKPTKGPKNGRRKLAKHFQNQNTSIPIGCEKRFVNGKCD